MEQQGVAVVLWTKPANTSPQWLHMLLILVLIACLCACVIMLGRSFMSVFVPQAV